MKKINWAIILLLGLAAMLLIACPSGNELQRIVVDTEEWEEEIEVDSVSYDYIQLGDIIID